MMVGAVSPATAYCTGTPRTARPRASSATAVKTTTSPVRTDSALASSVSDVTGFASTSMASVSAAPSARTDSSTVPGRDSDRKPWRSTLATAGSALAYSTATSRRTAPLVSTTSAASRGCVPT